MARPLMRAAWAVLASAAAGSEAANESRNCFVLSVEQYVGLDQLSAPPFPDDAVAAMRGHFLANLNLQGTGAVVASPGRTPALDSMGFPPKAYTYDWMRDGALSAFALQRMLGSEAAEVGSTDSALSEEVVDKVLQAYVKRANRTMHREGRKAVIDGKNTSIDAHGEPKWNLESDEPYGGHWCRPQTDGPGLRAMALIAYANRTYFRSLAMALTAKRDIWRMVKFDLDWLANRSSISMDSCDLWEGTLDRSFLWNRLTMRAGLLAGARFARDLGDEERARAYEGAVEDWLTNPFDAHVRGDAADDAVLTECSLETSKDAPCRRTGQEDDGAVILALIHSGWLEHAPSQSGASLEPAPLPTSVAVANTVQRQNEEFCDAYAINRNDTLARFPGVLYGRWGTDVYGGGNPWVLITAALASLLYQAAQVVAQGPALTAAEAAAWRAALNAGRAFRGTAAEFVAAGDSVMIRLRLHVEADDNPDWHLWEQIDKWTGKQYNAKDLTWSYAEVLAALRERETALSLGLGPLGGGGTGETILQ